jgi:thermostable 8-oxoguanine DNA glycosylase
VCVANKNARQIRPKVEAFLNTLVTTGIGETPFEAIRHLCKIGRLERVLRAIKLGPYRKLVTALTQAAHAGLQLEECTVADIVKIDYIGQKTARLFILYSRENQRMAVLDTHILKFLRAEGYDVPKAPPQSIKRYEEIEKMFLAEADKRGMAPADLDAQVWEAYSRKAAEGEKCPTSS